MTPKNRHFIIIDDDPINNLLCSKNIKKNIPEADIIAFKEAEKGLDYIKSFFSESNVGNAILLLDINMPTMSGWEFMQKFKMLDETIKHQISIYILSSSIHQDDKQKAKEDPYIVDYVEKPLSVEFLKRILALS